MARSHQEAAAHGEQGHHGGGRSARRGDHVPVAEITGDGHLFFQGFFQGEDPVAQYCGCFELLLVGRLLHAATHITDQLRGAAA